MVFKKIGLYSASAIAICTLVLMVSLILPAEVPESQTLPAHLLPPQQLTTETWGIFNPETGEVIVGNNIDSALPIASITKLFTAHAVVSSTKKNVPFTVSASDIETEGQAGKLAVGEEVTPYALLYPLLIESSNDAAEAIARSLGTDFADSVYTAKEELSLNDTLIVEPTGLSAENVSSVQDLSRFYRYIREVEPHLLDITQVNTFIGPYTGYINNDPARALPSFRGGKHGFTDEAKKTFVGTFTPSETGTEIGVVLLKSEDLLADIEALLAYGAEFSD